MLLIHSRAVTTSWSRHPDGTMIATTRGEIDIATADQWEAELLARIEGGLRELIVDLADVTFFGAAGVHVLERLLSRLRARGARLVVAQPARPARTVLKLCGLDWLAEPARPDRRECDPPYENLGGFPDSSTRPGSAAWRSTTERGAHDVR